MRVHIDDAINARASRKRIRQVHEQAPVAIGSSAIERRRQVLQPNDLAVCAEGLDERGPIGASLYGIQIGPAGSWNGLRNLLA